MAELNNVVIVDAARSAYTKGGRGALTGNRLDDVGAKVLRALLDRNPKVSAFDIEDIGLGQVGNAAELAGIGADNIAKLAGLPAEVCTFETNRQCGSSMETLHRVAQSIMVGASQTGVSLGIERMGRQLGGGGDTGEKNRVTSAAVETKFLSKPIVAGPGEACTETYLVAGRFQTQDTAERYAAYLRTRFVRFLVSLRKATQHATRDVYAFVPDLPMDRVWTDEDLYGRYGIRADERTHIESTVAEMPA